MDRLEQLQQGLTPLGRALKIKLSLGSHHHVYRAPHSKIKPKHIANHALCKVSGHRLWHTSLAGYHPKAGVAALIFAYVNRKPLIGQTALTKRPLKFRWLPYSTTAGQGLPGAKRQGVHGPSPCEPL